LLPSQTAQAVLQKVEGAIKSFIKLRRNNPNATYPRYHKRNIAWGDIIQIPADKN
jgi:hypothetical protein